MDRQLAASTTRKLLDEYGLLDWRITISTEPNSSFHGMCDHKTKTIILSGYSMDLLPESEAIDTIKHEIAHAIIGSGFGHGPTWIKQAESMGVRTLICTKSAIPEHVIDAIRSGHMVEFTVEEEIIRRPKYTVTQLKDVCPDCGKVAKEKFSINAGINKDGNEVKLITLECFHIITKIIPRGTPFESMVRNDWNPIIRDCKHEWTKHKCDKCGEFRLMPFQVIGARAAEMGLSTQKGFGVFDEMGLGKTVQALAVIKFHSEYTPTLYIVKSAIKFQWFKQIIAWLGPAYLPQIISTGRDFIFPGLKSYVISYDLIKKLPKGKLDALGIKLAVLDECQQIKNPDSTRTKEVRTLLGNPSIKVLPMSGTPWKNRGGEFFPVLNMIDPIKFYSYQGYLDRWVDWYYKGNSKKQGGIRNIEKFREYTSSLLIRREFNEVIEDYPDFNAVKLNVQLDELSQTTYDDSVSDFIAWYNNAVIGGEEDALNGMEILAKLSRMRHITGLAKIPATLGFVEEFIEETNRKLVIFIHHKDVGVLMINALTDTNKTSNPDWYDLAQTIKDENIKIMKLGSEFSDGERFTIQEVFNKTPRVIMIASTLASGEGMDLPSCADAIMHERQWNPANEQQALPGRFKRIGQTSAVINGTYVEAEGTVDEFLDELVEGKRRNFHAVMNKGAELVWDEGDIGKQLAEMIIKKHKEKNKHKIPVEGAKSLTSQASL